ncbi:MAG: phage tail protein [Clostridia bacterium]|nr:phage tail protein [Clostridia bacterium]
MYAIYDADGNLIYHPVMAEYGYCLTAAQLSGELNKAGSLKITIPPVNPMYDRLKKLTSEVVVKQDDTEIWRGRVLYNDQDFNNCRSIFCEGQLAYLNDAVIRPYTYKGDLRGLLQKYIDAYNEQTAHEPWKRFTLGTVDVPGTADTKSVDYASVWNEINNQLLAKFGGYIKIRRENDKSYVDYTAASGNADAQPIQFGNNLLDLTEHISAEDIFTVLIPLGKDQGEEKGRLTISSVNGGKDYLVNTAAVNVFGYIWRTEVFGDIEDPTALKQKGETFLTSGGALTDTIELRAVDLSDMGIDTDRIQLGNSNPVISVPHGVNSSYVCVKFERNLLDSSASVFTYGATLQAMTDLQLQNIKQAQATANQVIDVTRTANAAISTANAAASTATAAAGNAEVAVQTANTASVQAGAAVDAANKAVNAVNVATGAVDAAEAAAQAAQTALQEASDKFALKTTVDALNETVANKQNALGFTPVQQGGGADMAGNKIYIGWSGTQLKAQVDVTPIGEIVTTGAANGVILPVAKGGTGASDAATGLKNLQQRVNVDSGFFTVIDSCGSVSPTLDKFGKHIVGCLRMTITAKTTDIEHEYLRITDVANHAPLRSYDNYFPCYVMNGDYNSGCGLVVMAIINKSGSRNGVLRIRGSQLIAAGSRVVIPLSYYTA